jgi:hypothetical protein
MSDICTSDLCPFFQMFKSTFNSQIYVLFQILKSASNSQIYGRFSSNMPVTCSHHMLKNYSFDIKNPSFTHSLFIQVIQKILMMRVTIKLYNIHVPV